MKIFPLKKEGREGRRERERKEERKEGREGRRAERKKETLGCFPSTFSFFSIPRCAFPKNTPFPGLMSTLFQ